MSWIPAGAEESEDEDDFLDDFYDNRDSLSSPEKSEPIAGTSVEVEEKIKPKLNSLIKSLIKSIFY